MASQESPAQALLCQEPKLAPLAADLCPLEVLEARLGGSLSQLIPCVAPCPHQGLGKRWPLGTGGMAGCGAEPGAVYPSDRDGLCHK